MAKPLDLLDIYENELPQKDFVFMGLRTKTISFISGAGGLGKSMLALHLAFSLADTSCSYNFEPMVNKDTKRGQITYLNLEDPEEVLKERVKSISKAINRNTIEIIHKNLFIYPLYGKNFKLFNNKKELIEVTYETLIKLGKKNRLIIIDTFRRLIDTDENDNGMMSEVLTTLENVCNETGTSILLLHHQNKSAINEKNNNQTAMRGASALVDNARLVINLSTLSEKEAKEYQIQEERRKEYVKVSYAKVNYAKILNDFILAKGFEGTLSLCNCKKSNTKENNGKSRKKF